MSKREMIRRLNEQARRTANERDEYRLDVLRVAARACDCELRSVRVARGVRQKAMSSISTSQLRSMASDTTLVTSHYVGQREVLAQRDSDRRVFSCAPGIFEMLVGMERE